MRRATSYPVPPTSSLPPLVRLALCSTEQVSDAFQNLRAIYCRNTFSVAPTLLRKLLPNHLLHDKSVPDSGYASADDEDEGGADSPEVEVESDAFDIDVLRSDAFERDFATRWLTGFIARSDVWVTSVDSDARAALVDDAASILAAFAGDDEEEALTRRFTFEGGIDVELNDAPLLTEDHTSVGLQSWGSSILLAERLCANPHAFGLSIRQDQTSLRVLELGAGTGLLSIVAAKILRAQRLNDTTSTVVATDYHPSVLANLRSNVTTNFGTVDGLLVVRALDWQYPVHDGPFALPFGVILAADVIYHPEHARWIKKCAERLLTRPDDVSVGGIFWLIIPLRPTGRHEGMSNTVEEVFPQVSQQDRDSTVHTSKLELVILDMQKLARHEGVGRADEGGYKLYRIGWVRRE
ncbi:hypothetical protein IEO21_01222 [Rhodonia placenta]|uniref:Uncharacterized protein n=1 Tax=Rhodonia placenta TaxID=104341 RepID=A0A8H7U5L1_9APHY|nr:hypothetical protein IEO21_01222 [Postia placenta]